MAQKMPVAEFLTKLREAESRKSLYVSGCFGAPMSESNKNTYIGNYSYNKKPQRAAMIRAASADTFGFDCVCLIKGVLWGWTGDTSKRYGGASYASRGVPDVGDGAVLSYCQNVSASGWDKMVPGEVLWMTGHVGVYIGDGLAIECSPAWKNGVQKTAVLNIGPKAGYNGRKWTKHGMMTQWIDYQSEEDPTQEQVNAAVQQALFSSKATLQAIIRETIAADKVVLTDKDAGDWSKAARDWSVSSGLIQGTGRDASGNMNYAWLSPLDRQQLVTVLYRFAQMIGQA